MEGNEPIVCVSLLPACELREGRDLEGLVGFSTQRGHSLKSTELSLPGSF